MNDENNYGIRHNVNERFILCLFIFMLCYIMGKFRRVFAVVDYR